MSSSRSSSSTSISPLILIFILLYFIPMAHMIREFHGRDVVVEYKHYFFQEDTLDFAFYAEGTCNVKFNITDGHRSSQEAPLPRDFSVTVTGDSEIPVEKHLTQYTLPSYFDVTVTCGEDAPETQHFR